MDVTKTNIPTDDDTWAPLSSDDMNTLQYVLKNVRGAYPVRPYRQSDFEFAAEHE